ncbi:MAG TPA: hypothetical protein VEI48_07875 [Candidatus Sulfotelmatobacter sp.]|nr:hypothetical protein [Candidatus Sulfotelmatobacter sp.]
MKRLLLMILAACAGALVLWRVTRDEEPESESWDPDSDEPTPR